MSGTGLTGPAALQRLTAASSAWPVKPVPNKLKKLAGQEIFNTEHICPYNETVIYFHMVQMIVAQRSAGLKTKDNKLSRDTLSVACFTMNTVYAGHSSVPNGMQQNADQWHELTVVHHMTILNNLSKLSHARNHCTTGQNPAQCTINSALFELWSDKKLQSVDICLPTAVYHQYCSSLNLCNQ